MYTQAAAKNLLSYGWQKQQLKHLGRIF